MSARLEWRLAETSAGPVERLFFVADEDRGVIVGEVEHRPGSGQRRWTAGWRQQSWGWAMTVDEAKAAAVAYLRKEAEVIADALLVIDDEELDDEHRALVEAIGPGGCELLAVVRAARDAMHSDPYEASHYHYALERALDAWDEARERRAGR